MEDRSLALSVSLYLGGGQVGAMSLMSIGLLEGIDFSEHKANEMLPCVHYIICLPALIERLNFNGSKLCWVCFSL